jgi:hypothetical protein
VKCELLWTVGADANVRNIIHFRMSGVALQQSDINAMASSVATSMETHLTGVTLPQVVFNGATCIDLSSPTGVQATQSTSQAGTMPAGEQAASVCVLVNHAIPVRYRGGHPRTYLPWGSSAQLASPNAWLGSFVSTCQTAWNGFIGSLKGQTFTSGAELVTNCSVAMYSGSTWHQKPNGDWEEIPTPRGTPVLYDIGSSSVSPVPGTQRRRLRAG